MHAEKFQNTEISRKFSITAQLQLHYKNYMKHVRIIISPIVEPDRYHLISRKYSKEQRAFKTRI